jgi:hypothetical protein
LLKNFPKQQLVLALELEQMSAKRFHQELAICHLLLLQALQAC